MRRPLDRIPSLKLKLGLVIVAAVFVTAFLAVVAANTQLPVWLGGVLAVAAALLMVQFLARGMTAPLRAMAAAATAMAAGRYDRRVETDSRDEVGELAEAFNRDGRGARRRRHRAARADRQRVARAAHADQRAARGAREHRRRGRARRAGDAAHDAGPGRPARPARVPAARPVRLEARDTTLESRTFAVAPMLEAAVREAQIGTRRPGVPAVRVDLSVEPSELSASGDPERIQQVVANLLDNAILHSPDGGRVAVGARHRAAVVELEVCDEGPGIPPGEGDRIFERFYRAPSAHSPDGGTGLGLAIASSIVELHGGTIHAEGRSPHGCRMIVALPGNGQG